MSPTVKRRSQTYWPRLNSRSKGVRAFNRPLWGEMPSQAHAIHARVAVYAKDFVGDRVYMGDPNSIRQILAPQSHLILTDRTDPRQTPIQEARRRLDRIGLQLAALIGSVAVGRTRLQLAMAAEGKHVQDFQAALVSGRAESVLTALIS